MLAKAGVATALTMYKAPSNEARAFHPTGKLETIPHDILRKLYLNLFEARLPFVGCKQHVEKHQRREGVEIFFVIG